MDPDGRIAVTTVATGFGVLYVGYKYATDAQLREDTGELIKAGVKATVDTVKWTGKTVAKGAQWAGEKISEGVSAAKAYFSKGKKVRNKENSPIPPGNQNSQQRQGNELEPEKPEIPDPSKLGEPGYMPPGNGGGGGWKNNVIVAGFLALLYDASKGTVPPIPSAPTPLSPPGKQTPVMESYPPADNGLGSNKQNTTNLKGK